MINRILNLLKLIQALRERGNWPFIRRSRKQLIHFILCQNDLIQKPIWQTPFYWLHLLKGYEALIWRLETFGFLYPPGFGQKQKDALNRKLQRRK